MRKPNDRKGILTTPFENLMVEASVLWSTGFKPELSS
jgi:hypothetical protein